MPTLGLNRKHEMATKRLDETAWRWVRAGRMPLAGKTPAQAAHAASVARQTAYSWKAVLEDGEIDALRVMPTRGWRSRLHSVGATLAEVLRTLGPAHLREHALSTVQARAASHRRVPHAGAGRHVATVWPVHRRFDGPTCHSVIKQTPVDRLASAAKRPTTHRFGCRVSKVCVAAGRRNTPILRANRPSPSDGVATPVRW